MINTNVFFDFTDFQAREAREARATHIACGSAHSICVTVSGEVLVWGRGKSGRLGLGPATHDRYVEVFVVHVGGTRCVTSSIENIMNIQARITLTVECIRGYIFLF
jgi:hypothetical protein